jgi:hypothetical protein
MASVQALVYIDTMKTLVTINPVPEYFFLEPTRLFVTGVTSSTLGLFTTILRMCIHECPLVEVKFDASKMKWALESPEGEDFVDLRLRCFLEKIDCEQAVVAVELQRRSGSRMMFYRLFGDFVRALGRRAAHSEFLVYMPKFGRQFVEKRLVSSATDDIREAASMLVDMSIQTAMENVLEDDDLTCRERYDDDGDDFRLLEAWAVDDFTLKPDDITTDLPKLIEIVRKGLDSNSASIRINAAGALSAMTREPSTRAIMREAGLVDVLRTMALSGNSCVRLEACINALASLAIGDTS